MIHKHTNRLALETSPYLLQHAHNPVDWFPWGEEALNKAKQEDKPILVSIGYAACHWCHVMERESFENEETALLMNEHFINIKIDREERPDIDHIYMDAVQAMTGAGGWPLNVFLTPAGKPFYGGTYFPPQRAFNRASWTEVLNGVMLAFKGKRNEIDAQAENLMAHLHQSNAFGFAEKTNTEGFSKQGVEKMVNLVMKTADSEWGGFGQAPKFPQTFTIRFLLRNQVVHREDKMSRDHALASLDKMINGGIYDQLGGGFARYSTDREWLAPHFEKMLYDNALLVDVLSEAYQFTGKEKYRKVIEETIDFVERELMDQDGGFYSALDADSEGVEGKFYVWKMDEVKELLGDEGKLFCEFFDITAGGNWKESHGLQGGNILRVLKEKELFAKEHDLAIEEAEKIISKGKKILLSARAKRVQPLLDDKIILGWNALMNAACSKAFMATSNPAFKLLAEKNMNFILKNFTAGENAFFHTWKNGKPKFNAFLDDYAFLIQALIHLQEISLDKQYLIRAKSITEFVIDHFLEEESGFFFFTSDQQKDVIMRKKEVYDGAVPSGNAIMAWNLYKLAVLFEKDEWKKMALKMLNNLEDLVLKYPGSFGNWAGLYLELVAGTNEMVITGDKLEKLHQDILREYIPHRVLMATKTGDNDWPLLKEKKSYEQAAVFLCRNYSCLAPVFSVKDLMSLINSPQNH